MNKSKPTYEELLQKTKEQEIEIINLLKKIPNNDLVPFPNETKKKESKQKLIKENHLYSFISQINQVIVRTTDSKKLFNEACSIAIEYGKFKMAWIGLINTSTQKVNPVAFSESGQNIIKKIAPISLKISKNIKSPIQSAIINDSFIVCNDIEKSEFFIENKANFFNNGCNSLLVIPIKKNKNCIGVFVLYSNEKKYFETEQIKMLLEVNSDIEFALEFIDKEKQRKITEAKVIESEKRYQSLTEVSPVGIFRTNAKGDTTYVNNKWCEITGLSFKKALGKGWINALLEEDRYRLLKEWNNNVVNTKITTTEYRFVQPNGNIVWVIGNAIPEKNINNKVIGYVGTITDITQRKQSEVEFIKVHQKMKAILDAIPDLLFEIDINGVIHNCHSRNEELLLLPLNSIINKTIFEILPNDAAKACNTGIKEASVKGFSNGIQYKLDLPSGVHWFELSIATMQKNQENYTHFIALSREITERVEMGIEITKAKEQAEKANQYKTEFLANMSHEIRTPLNGIIGFSQLLINSKLDETQLEYMSTINESATSLMQIVNDVLDFSEIESGKLKIIIEKVSLYELANQTINLFKYQASQKDINLLLKIHETVPEFIYIDPFRLKQVLLNLLSNSLKFTSIGEIKLTISATPSTNLKYSNLYFSVKDTGIGIKKSNQKNIFKSFVQEDNSTRRKFGGTGLGLAISNKLLAMMKSKLELESEKDIGSNFFFTLKVKIAELNEYVLNPETKHEDELISFKIEESKKILIVEDNKINMFLIKTLVKKIVPNAIIIEAFDGLDAIKAYEKESFDIILIDIQMPNMNGYDATKHIRSLKNSDKIPIIAITAGILPEEKEKCFTSGMNDYLPKPIIFNDLAKVFEKWIV
jgi:PAS domain S-box-containing protein